MALRCTPTLHRPAPAVAQRRGPVPVAALVRSPPHRIGDTHSTSISSTSCAASLVSSSRHLRPHTPRQPSHTHRIRPLVRRRPATQTHTLPVTRIKRDYFRKERTCRDRPRLWLALFNGLRHLVESVCCRCLDCLYPYGLQCALERCFTLSRRLINVVLPDSFRRLVVGDSLPPKSLDAFQLCNAPGRRLHRLFAVARLEHNSSSVLGVSVC